MTYPFITRFKKEIMRTLLVERAKEEEVSASSIVEELVGLWIMGRTNVSGKKKSDIYRENGHKLDNDIKL
jgi:hypothetical protein